MPLLPSVAPPPDISTNGWRVTWLFWYTNYLTAAAFALVVLALVVFAWRYRARKGHKAVYDPGSGPAALTGTVALSLLVFVSIDMVLVKRSNEDVRGYLYRFPAGPNVVKVEVYPQQWAWNFRYAGPDGAFGTKDDVVTLNDLRIPAGRPVMLNLKAKDVIHSFYVPNLRLKQDANPGSVTRMWFTAKTPGLYEVACSQMCGWAHYKMRGEMRVLPEAEYQSWLKEAEGDAARRYDASDTEAQWGWEWQQQ
jgi:cytochrome c oxidase subunit 2